MKRFLAACCLVLLGTGARADGSTISADRNKIDVIDGDTLQIGPTAVQLAGIDAPELGQICSRTDRTIHCGLDAGRALQKVVRLATQAIVCTPTSEVSGATVATCLLGERDISLMLIDGGYVAALPDAPAAYLASEKQAKTAGLGIWGGTFMPPVVWRAENRSPSDAAQAIGICPFRGIPDEQGQRLYYGPLDPDHSHATGSGQSGPLFCSDEEARESGWRYAQAKH